MQMRDFLPVENVFVGLNSSSKERLLLQLSEFAAEKTSASAQAVTKALREREALGSTGIGGGIALPHTGISDLKTIFCLAARLAKPIDFEAVDDQPVDLVVLLLTPAAARTDALNILSCIARCFREEATARALRAARSPEEVHFLLTK